mmetsp:Transcript_32935/g.81819  ORF Transcript_32935/g.81819 Transcript_32935/m.81819 type:complete len:348 (-) Transcript_32935:7-1050(-)
MIHVEDSYEYDDKKNERGRIVGAPAVPSHFARVAGRNAPGSGGAVVNVRTRVDQAVSAAHALATGAATRARREPRIRAGVHARGAPPCGPLFARRGLPRVARARAAAAPGALTQPHSARPGSGEQWRSLPHAHEPRRHLPPRRHPRRHPHGSGGVRAPLPRLVAPPRLRHLRLGWPPRPLPRAGGDGRALRLLSRAEAALDLLGVARAQRGGGRAVAAPGRALPARGRGRAARAAAHVRAGRLVRLVARAARRRARGPRRAAAAPRVGARAACARGGGGLTRPRQPAAQARRRAARHRGALAHARLARALSLNLVWSKLLSLGTGASSWMKLGLVLIKLSILINIRS